MSVPTAVPVRRLLAALILCCALLAGGTACSRGGDTAQDTATVGAAAAAAATPSPSTPAERPKFAKTRLGANAGLAAGEQARARRQRRGDKGLQEPPAKAAAASWAAAVAQTGWPAGPASREGT